MKSYVLTAFAATFLGLFSFAQQASSPADSKSARFGGMFTFGSGLSLGTALDNVKFEDYFSYTNGPAMQTGLEMMYVFHQRDKRRFFVSSGVTFASVGSTAMPDPFTHYTFNNNLVQVPLIFSIEGDIKESPFSTFVSVGVCQNFQTNGSYLIKENSLTDVVSKQNLSDNFSSLLTRIGIKASVANDLFFIASANTQTALSDRKLSIGSATINMGFGFGL